MPRSPHGCVSTLSVHCQALLPLISSEPLRARPHPLNKSPPSVRTCRMARANCEEDSLRNVTSQRQGERVLRRQMPRRKATSGGKTLRTRGRFSTETSCCSSANPLCKTGQVSQWMQTQVGMPDDSRVTAQGSSRPGGKATTTRNEEENLPERGSAGSPLETTLVGSGESVKVAKSRSGGPELTATIHAAAALTLTSTIHAAAALPVSITIHAAAQPRPVQSPPSPGPPSPGPPSPGPPDRTLGATEPLMSAGLWGHGWAGLGWVWAAAWIVTVSGCAAAAWIVAVSAGFRPL